MIKCLWRSIWGEGKILYDPQLVSETWVKGKIVREGLEWNLGIGREKDCWTYEYNTMIREKRNKGYVHGSIEIKIQNFVDVEMAQWLWVHVAFEENASSVSSATWSSSKHQKLQFQQEPRSSSGLQCMRTQLPTGMCIHITLKFLKIHL